MGKGGKNLKITSLPQENPKEFAIQDVQSLGNVQSWNLPAERTREEDPLQPVNHS